MPRRPAGASILGRWTPWHEVAEATERPLVARLDLDLKEAISCEVARRTAQEKWLGERDRILSSLRVSLADPDEQERNLASNAAKIARILDLSDAERARFEARYRIERLRAVSEAREALSRDPPDWRSVHQSARDVFAAEDAAVRALFGEEAERRLRMAEAEGRTALLAISATLAELPFESSTEW